MKKLAVITAMTLMVTTCSVPATGDQTEYVAHPVPQNVGLVEWLTEQKEAQTLLEQQAEAAAKKEAAEQAQEQKVLDNTVKLNEVVARVVDRVDKTRYVFSGSTPKGWDCSGLVLWAYGELGIELEHRASKQQYAGTEVDHPKLGDIVVFVYNGRKSSYHVGIYLYPDTMIHAGGDQGDATEIVSISKFAGKHSTVTYRRLVETQ
jgi:peptidoglycan endopeptidase LytE